MNKRISALLTGWTLIVMAIVAGFSIGFAFSEFNQAKDLESLKYLIQTRQTLYKSMLIGLSVIVLLDLLVTFTLYKYFEEVNKKISFIAAISRILYTLIFGIAFYFLVLNLAYNELSNQQINQNFHLFEVIWNGGLVIFGIHLGLVGYLMMLEKVFPTILVLLVFFAAASYLVVHALKLVAVNQAILEHLEMWLAFPMAIGELGLAIWLIGKGGKFILKPQIT